MKFSIGYQLAESMGESIVELVQDYRHDVAEVYFPWVGGASGRAALGRQRGYIDWGAQRYLEEDLIGLREQGVHLNLLFNANCYGARAVSQQLEHEVMSIIEHLGDLIDGPDSVTTTSMTIAHILKTHVPTLQVRASINMRLGTVQALRYAADLFDFFYLQRDFNRDLGHLAELKAWAEAHGKGIGLLANSGCLRFCPGQTFHDNLVAHDAEIDEQRNLPDWTPHVCWRHYRDEGNWPALLQSTWIRPEDVHHYAHLTPVIKLATRMHSHPRLVLHAYAAGRHHGNLLDLLEPAFSRIVAPAWIDNDAFPEDWFSRTSSCGAGCDRCTYCAETLAHVLRTPASDG